MARTNAWTGGQYSLFRVLLAGYLLCHFVALGPWALHRGFHPDGRNSIQAGSVLGALPNALRVSDSPWLLLGVLAGGIGLGMLFLAGWADRWAGLAVAFLWLSLTRCEPVLLDPRVEVVAWLLLAHAFVPAAPYLSWAARGRLDPAGSWRMPSALFLLAWVGLSLTYTFNGLVPFTKSNLGLLSQPGPGGPSFLTPQDDWSNAVVWGILTLQLLYVPLVLLRRYRKWAWTFLLVLLLTQTGLTGQVSFGFAVVHLHLFTFDPGWVSARKAPVPEMVFYDGHCGLCHRSLRFILAEDRTGEAFRFAPLDSDVFREAVPEDRRPTLPDSVVVLTADGRLLARSEGVLHIARALGGVWRLLAHLAGLTPIGLRDRLYDVLAAVRHRLFRRPKEVCPILPPQLRARFMG